MEMKSFQEYLLAEKTRIVIQGLLELCNGPYERKPLLKSWARRRRRSAIASQDSPPPPMITAGEDEVVVATASPAVSVAISTPEEDNKAEALGGGETCSNSSPRTPLGLPLSDATDQRKSEINDNNSNSHLGKKRKRNKLEKLEAAVEYLLQQNQVLKETLMKVSDCYEEQKRERVLLEEMLKSRHLVASTINHPNNKNPEKVEWGNSSQCQNSQMLDRVSPNGLLDLNLPAIVEENTARF